MRARVTEADFHRPAPERKQGFFMPKTQPIAPPVEIAPVLPHADPHASAVGVLFALSFCHLLNDAIQALIPAIYPTPR